MMYLRDILLLHLFLFLDDSLGPARESMVLGRQPPSSQPHLVSIAVRTEPPTTPSASLLLTSSLDSGCKSDTRVRGHIAQCIFALAHLILQASVWLPA